MTFNGPHNQRHQGADDDVRVEPTVNQTVSLDAPTITLAPSLPPQSRYRIDGEFARGGIGRILKAHDQQLDREVAVKTLLSVEAGHRERFQREAAITARLQHPAIVPVHDLGVWSNGAPYYVMKLISGGVTLKEAVANASDFNARLALLPNVIAIADAIAYAHSVGIIHRDLKPSNVLVGPFGETVVIDWGLAKEIAIQGERSERRDGPYRQNAPELTTAGSIVGTPQYMAPEQARGEPVDMRADVYALGAILYYVLSGHAPHAGASTAEVLQALLDEAPVPIAEREPAIPQDLATIVGTAMARTPASRYKSASEFAEDLKRFQTGQLVSAHNYSRRALVRRWLRRNRRLAAVATSLVILLAATAMWSVRRIVRERNIARDRSSELIVSQAKSSLATDPTSALGWLKLYPHGGPDSDRAAAIAADAVSRGVARHVLANDKKVVRLAFSPDGTWLASGGDENVVKLWEVAGGRLRRTLPFREVYALAVSPDGTSVAAAGGEDGQIRLWDTVSDRARDLKHDQAMIAELQFLDGGKRLLSHAEDGTLYLWDLAGRRGERLPPATAMAVSPDGTRFATVGVDDVVALRDVAGGRPVRLGRHRGHARFLIWSQRGDTLVSGGDDAIELWDLGQRRARTLPPIGPLAHATAELCPSVALSADGEWLAAVTRDKALHVWKLKDGTHTATSLPGSLPSVLAFAPVGHKLAVGDVRGLLRLVDVGTGAVRELRGHTNYIHWLTFSPSGDLLATASSDKTIRLWGTKDQAEHVLSGHGGPVLEAVYSPDSRLLATADSEGGIALWNEASGEHALMKGHQTVVRGIRFSPDGKLLVSASWDKSARIWNVGANDQTGTPIGLPGAAERVVFLPGNQRVVVTAGAGVWLADVQGGALRQLGGHEPNSAIYSLRLSPTAPLVATAGADGTIHLVRLDGQGERILRGHEGEVFTAEFSANGAQLLSSSADGTVRLWDVSTGTSRLVRRQRGPVRPAAFVLGDKQVASAGSGGAVVLVDLTSGAVSTLRGHDQEVLRLAVSPDGARLASAATDGTVRIWELATGRSALVAVPGADALALTFSNDGRHLAIGDTQAYVREYDVAALTFVPAGRSAEFARWLDQTTDLTIGARQ